MALEIAHTPEGDHILVQTMEDANLVEYIRLDRKLWLVEDKSKVVEDGDEDAAFLYGVEGTLVAQQEAEKLGALPDEKKKDKTKPEDKQADKPEDKQAAKPADK